MTFDTFHALTKDGTILYVGMCLHIAQASAEVSRQDCTVLKNGSVIFTYSSKPKKWKSHSYLW